MGFFDNLKKVAIKAKCGVGIHSGEFKKTNGKTCQYEKICADCGKYLTKEIHQYGRAEYKSLHECIKIQKCTNCGHEKEFTNHEEFREIAVDDYCNVKVECKRCSFQKLDGKQHNWFIDDITDTHNIYKCTKCGEKDFRQKTNFKS